MKPRNERPDSGFDRLVERELARAAGPAAEPCPQVELLAAWFDRALPSKSAEGGADSAAAIERHLSACRRCQQVVAGLVRSEPEVLYVHPQPAPHRWTWHIRWMAPLGATAVVLLSVAAYLGRPGEVPKDLAMASPAQGPLAEPAHPLREAAANPEAEASRREAAKVGVLPTAPSERLDRPLRPAATGQATSAEAAGDKLAGALTAEAKRRKAENAAEPAAPAPPMMADAAQAAPAAAGARPEPQASKEVGGVQLPAATPSPSPVLAPSGEGAATARARVTSFAQSPSFRSVAATAPPGGRVAWRYVGPGLVSRTEDGGATWSDQSLPGGARVTALAAVTPTICWAVGPSGTVLRTTDGRSWNAVGSPAGDDLVAVAASSETHATVRTADGTTYETSDGVTWHRR